MEEALKILHFRPQNVGAIEKVLDLGAKKDINISVKESQRLVF